MTFQKLLIRIKNGYRRMSGSTIEYDLTPYRVVLREIQSLYPVFKDQSDSDLKAVFQQLRDRSRQSENPDHLLVEVFALVREAAWRILELIPFDEQIIGGIAMHRKKLIEMNTGEGKTLTALFPVSLNALSGRGVHVLTFNDYLAGRDAQWMGPVYEFLGLSVGSVQEGMSIKARQEAYQSDITYVTAKESGFDFLRDSLCVIDENRVHRPFHFALIDEADSICIDEARIPLIIAGASEETIADPYLLAQTVKRLDRNKDIEFDPYERNVHLTEGGLQRVESLLGCPNLYDEAHLDLLTRLNCALHAEYLLHLDTEYILRDGKIELVDALTGRVADKRRWPDGLQAALEAKENIAIQSKGHILNSITLQHFIQLYPNIAGMTATARSAEEEFRDFYHLQIVVIPPNSPCVRQDQPDVIFPNMADKLDFLVKEILRAYKTRRPILVGTRSVGESEELAGMLRDRGVSCEVLNAKRDAYEAKIIARAGEPGAVTISTNMAGRGVDIRLGGEDESRREEVTDLGGLYVIGTNKHESQRIDNQLRGRAGRQGDPGSSRFFVSLEDELFVKYRLKELFPSQLIDHHEDPTIIHPVVIREVNRLQRIIEGQNLEIKKTLFQYSALIEKQRMLVFLRRQNLLSGDNSVLDFYRKIAPDQYRKITRIADEKDLISACRVLSLYHLDRFWCRYLGEMAQIREGIHLTRLGGQTPLFEFHKQAVAIFDELQQKADLEMAGSFRKIRITVNKMDLSGTGIKLPSSTWTYLVNDNPFENSLGIQLMGNTGLSIGAGIWGPLLVVFSLFQRHRKKSK